MISQQHLKSFHAALVVIVPYSYKPRLEPLLGLGVSAGGQMMRGRCTPQEKVPVQKTASEQRAGEVNGMEICASEQGVSPDQFPSAWEECFAESPRTLPQALRHYLQFPLLVKSSISSRRLRTSLHCCHDLKFYSVRMTVSSPN